MAPASRLGDLQALQALAAEGSQQAVAVCVRAALAQERRLPQQQLSSAERAAAGATAALRRQQEALLGRCSVAGELATSQQCHYCFAFRRMMLAFSREADLAAFLAMEPEGDMQGVGEGVQAALEQELPLVESPVQL
jgi:hypothetical protein